MLHDEYTFPYSTCEVPLTSSSSWMPEQPWSAFINVLILFILAAFLWQAKSWASRAFIVALFLFEASHTWAHWTHMGRGMQQTVTHFLAFAVNLSLIWLLHRISVSASGKSGKSGKSGAKQLWPSTWVWALWAALIVLDLWAFFFVGFVWSVLTQLLLFFSIFFAYYGSLPKWVQRLLWALLIFSGLIYGVIWNEKHNCARMLEFCPWFPWHVMVESLSIVPITLLASMFYRF